MPRSKASVWYFDNLDKLGCKIRGVIHVGAHLAEELDFYEERSAKHQVWVEPEPNIYKRMVASLPKRPEVHSFNVACGAKRETVTFRCVSGYSGEASSVMPLKRHLELYPDFKETHQIQVPMVPLDELLEEAGVDPSNFNLLVNDTQGYELHVMEGALKTLKHIKFAVVEVGTIELYEGSPVVADVDAWMARHGFERRASGWREKEELCGDVIYVRKLPLWKRILKRIFGVKGE